MKNTNLMKDKLDQLKKSHFKNDLIWQFVEINDILSKCNGKDF